jgi:hypothetical protein
MKEQLMRFCIPDDLGFSDLKLSRSADGVEVDFDIVVRICEASDIPIATFTEMPEQNLASLIVAWYDAHLAEGGDAHPVAESLIAEIFQEDAVKS